MVISGNTIAPDTDRRRHPRHELSRPCRVQDRRTGKFLHGTTCNYSAGGVLIRLHRPCRLQPGDALRIGIAVTEHHGFLEARDMFESTVVRAFGTPTGETMVAVRHAEVVAPLQTTLPRAA